MFHSVCLWTVFSLEFWINWNRTFIILVQKNILCNCDLCDFAIWLLGTDFYWLRVVDYSYRVLLLELHFLGQWKIVWPIVESRLAYSRSCEWCDVFPVFVFAFAADNITHIAVESDTFQLFLAVVIMRLFGSRFTVWSTFNRCCFHSAVLLWYFGQCLSLSLVSMTDRCFYL